MKTKIILIQILLLFNISSYSQHFVWAKSTSVSSSTGFEVSDMVVDSLGSIYATGGFSGTVDLGDTSFTANGNYNGFVAKFDTAWNLKWIKIFSSGDLTSCAAIDISQHGEIYFIGTFNGTLPIDSIQLTSLGSYDVFYARYDTSGVFKMAGSVGSISDDAGTGIAVRNGHFVICGNLSDTIYFADTLIAPFLIEGQCECSFIAFYDSTGAYNWAKYNASSVDMNDSVVVSASISTYFDGNMYYRNTNVNNYNYLGNLIWTYAPTLQTIGFSQVYGNDIVIDNDGNSYMCGMFVGPITWGNFSLSSAPPSTFITKYSPLGVPLWVNKITGDAANPNPKITIDNNSVYLNSSFYYPPAIIGNDTLITSGNDDLYIVKYSKSDSLIWSKQYGGIQTDLIYAFAVTNDNIIFTTGYSYNNPVFDDKTAPTGYFIAKLDTSHFLNVPYHLNENINLYPNPVTYESVIELNEFSNYELLITDIIGKVVNKSSYTGSSIPIGHLNLPVGMYCFMITDSGKCFNGKFIIKPK